MPACFLTKKMAAIGKDDGSEIEENKTVSLYKWWYCLPNSSTAYTIPSQRYIHMSSSVRVGFDKSSPAPPIIIIMIIIVTVTTTSCMYNNDKKET